MNRKTFTLIELLVVIAILTATLFPVFAQGELAACNINGGNPAQPIEN